MNLAKRLLEEVGKVRKHILVIGDSMTDVWVHGTLDECQEGCVKFVEEGRTYCEGGAANATNCLVSWPIVAHLFGRAPKDRPIKTRFVSRSGRVVFRHDDESVLQNDRKHHSFNKDVMEAIGWSSAVLLSDYDKGLLTPELIREVVGACRERGIPCVADCKRAPEVYKGAILKGNFLYSMHHADPLDIVTYGKNNPYVREEVHGPDMPYVKCVNHVGAGDCFAAHLTLALAYGFSLKDAAAIAHSAGRVYVQHPHNRPPLPEEIVADMGLAAKPATTARAASGSDDGREPV